MNPFPKIIVLTSLALLILPSASQAQNAAARAELQRRAAELLKRYPQTDTNRDGRLSREEFQAHVRRMQTAAARANSGIMEIKYGPHPRQSFDILPLTGAPEPTPLVIFIHGGGFKSGDKSKYPKDDAAKFVRADIAYATLNYRLSDTGPYPMMMHDAARAVQTIRHNAAEWNIDPERIACYGGSAGAGISLWLAFHDDLADPDSDDPIARQSTRLIAAGALNGQSTYDYRTFREWFNMQDVPLDVAITQLYAVKSPSDWESERVKSLMVDASPITHVTPDDPAVYMSYTHPNVPVTPRTPDNIRAHHVRYGLKLQEAMREVRVPCIVRAPDVIPKRDPYGSVEDFLIAKLKQ